MKKWLPFTITLVAALGTAAGLYIWKGAQINELEALTSTPVIGPLLTDAGKAPPRPAPKSKGGPESARIEASLRPTRNGMRSLFERAKHIMDLDQEHVLKLLAELEANGRIRSPLAGVNLMAAYARLAELDPAGAMQRALAQKSEGREIMMATVMNEWLARDRKGALAWFAKSEDMETKKKYLTIASIANGGSDPELINELGAALNDPEARSKAMLDSLGALAFSDPDAALKKLAEIEDPDEREKAGERVYEGFLMRYPQKALDYAMAQAPGDKARENARNSLVRWGEQDAAGALKWLTSQSKETQKELFDTDTKGPGWGFGKASVEEIGVAARQLGDQSQQDKLYAAWANSQSWTKPSEGLKNLNQIKDPELQKATAASIGMAAAQSGQVGDMSAWVADAIPNDTRDTAVAAFAKGLAQKDGPAAAEWAGKITNGVIRQETLSALKNPAPVETTGPNFRPGRRPQ